MDAKGLVILLVCVVVSKGNNSTKNNTKRVISNDQIILQSFALNPTPISNPSLEFSFKLMKRLIHADSNLVLSPFSIYTTLGMAHIGSSGATARQIEKSMQARKHKVYVSDIHDYVQKFAKMVEHKKDTLSMQNGLFLQDYLEKDVKPSYYEDLYENYAPCRHSVDFKDSKSTQVITDWISNCTGYDFSLQFSNSPVMSIMNAMQFNSTWKMPFQKNETIEAAFYKKDGDKKKVQFMTLRSKQLPYHVDKYTKVRFLELPFKQEGIVMLLALPQSSRRVRMTMPLLRRVYRNHFRPTDFGRIVIPKFDFQSSKTVNSLLRPMCLKDLFTGSADLAPIRARNDLKVYQIVHQARIYTDEQRGTVSAYTRMDFTSKFAPSLKVSPLANSNSNKENDFVVEHPFSFYILDKIEGYVLFSGYVADPVP